jgi:recombinational DNA repair protein (RecF pathway)
MQEYITEALVLDREDSGEQDSRVYLYTKEAGKLSCKVKSIRKITSKLSGHLQPANLVTVRIVDKNGAQLADALTFGKAEKTPALIKNLLLVKDLAAEGQPDITLWQFLENYFQNNSRDLADTGAVLSFFGFDPAFARCYSCQSSSPKFFFAPDTSFYCRQCSPAGAYSIA